MRGRLCALAWVASVGLTAACDDSAPPTQDPNAVGFPWTLPPGFPPPRVPSDNPMSVEKVRLGRSLFYDTRLSYNGTTACGSCHQQAYAFTDGRAHAVGSTGMVHRRSAMSLTNAAYNSAFSWANSLLRTPEQFVLVPMFGQEPVELGMTDHEADVYARFRADTAVMALFRAAFPGDSDPVTTGNVVKALASFVRTLISYRAPYDRALQGDPAAMSDAARRGQALFFGERLECYHCHGGFNFSDSTATASTTFDEVNFHNTGLYNLGAQGAYPAADQGLIEVSQRPDDMGKFRAPTLRNIALTAPYMHDGSVATLEEMLAHYGSGGRTIADGPNAGVGSANPHKDGLVLGFSITDAERADVLAFLRSLTDTEFVRDPRLANPFLTRSARCARAEPAACSAPAPGYRDEIAPIIQRRCASCHFTDGPGTRWPLGSRDALAMYAPNLVTQVSDCLMPPSESEPLTAAERARLLAWIACGTPDN